jgi:hypothetical protein
MPATVQIPLGVADPEGRIGCIALPDPALEAIDLASGQVLWRLDGPLVPLAIANGRVLARREDRLPYVLALEVLDARDGSRIAAPKPIALPRWVDLQDERTSVDAIPAGNSFTVRWSAAPRYRGGAPPSSGMLASMPAAEANGGAFSVDDSSNIAAVDADPPDASGPPGEARVGSRVLVLTPDAILEARDSTTGEKVWEKPILPGSPPSKLRP